MRGYWRRYWLRRECRRSHPKEPHFHIRGRPYPVDLNAPFYREMIKRVLGQ